MKNKVKLLKNNLYKIKWKRKFCKLVISNWEKVLGQKTDEQKTKLHSINK